VRERFAENRQAKVEQPEVELDRIVVSYMSPCSWPSLCTTTTTTTTTPFNVLFSGTTWISLYQKGKTSLDLNEARDHGVLGYGGISWTLRKQSRAYTWLQTDNHTNTSSQNFLQA